MPTMNGLPPDHMLKKAIAETEDAMAKMWAELKLRKDVAPEGSPEGTPPAEETPGEGSPGDPSGPTADPSAGSSDPASAGGPPAPAAGGDGAPGPDGASAGGDPAAAGAPTDPQALMDEYSKLSPEDLQVHLTAAMQVAQQMGIQVPGAGDASAPPAGDPAAGGPSAGADPSMGAPPGPSAGPSAAPPGPSAPPAGPSAQPDPNAPPMMGKAANDRMAAVAPSKAGGAGSNRLAPIAPTKAGGAGQNRLTPVMPTRKQENALPLGNTPGPMSGPANGQNPLEQVKKSLEAEIEKLKKSAVEKDLAHQTLLKTTTSLMSTLTGKLKPGTPLRKSITGSSQVTAPVRAPAPTNMSRAQILETLQAKTREGKLSKSQQAKVISFTMGNIDASEISDLLK